METGVSLAPSLASALCASPPGAPPPLLLSFAPSLALSRSTSQSERSGARAKLGGGGGVSRLGVRAGNGLGLKIQGARGESFPPAAAPMTRPF